MACTISALSSLLTFSILFLACTDDYFLSYTVNKSCDDIFSMDRPETYPLFLLELPVLV